MMTTSLTTAFKSPEALTQIPPLEYTDIMLGVYADLGLVVKKTQEVASTVKIRLDYEIMTAREECQSAPKKEFFITADTQASDTYLMEVLDRFSQHFGNVLVNQEVWSPLTSTGLNSRSTNRNIKNLKTPLLGTHAIPQASASGLHHVAKSFRSIEVSTLQNTILSPIDYLAIQAIRNRAGVVPLDLHPRQWNDLHCEGTKTLFPQIVAETVFDTEIMPSMFHDGKNLILSHVDKSGESKAGVRLSTIRS